MTCDIEAKDTIEGVVIAIESLASMLGECTTDNWQGAVCFVLDHAVKILEGIAVG